MQINYVSYPTLYFYEVLMMARPDALDAKAMDT